MAFLQNSSSSTPISCSNPPVEPSYLHSADIASANHKDNVRDHIVDKVIENVLSASLQLPATTQTNFKSESTMNQKETAPNEPDFSLSIFASNLRKISSKAGLLLLLPGLISHVLSWHQPALTISILVVYTYICFYPFLLCSLPVVLVLGSVLVPGYNDRHPISPNLLPIKFYKHHDIIDAEAEELAIQEMVELQLKKQRAYNEKMLIERLRDLQNGLGQLVQAFEEIEYFISNIGSFKDERKASATYLFLMMLIFSTTYFASFVSPHLVMIAIGWSLIVCLHPSIKVKVQKFLKEYFETDSVFLIAIKSLEKTEIIVDFAPDKQSVEIFELQKVGLTPRQWTPWLYTPVVYEIESSLRKKHERPLGTRFLEDIQPPRDWFFKDDDPWKLDTKTKVWVAHRGIKFVELDIENSWVYDYKNNERGDWRRRRWIRKCYSYGRS